MIGASLGQIVTKSKATKLSIAMQCLKEPAIEPKTRPQSENLPQW